MIRSAGGVGATVGLCGWVAGACAGGAGAVCCAGAVVGFEGAGCGAGALCANSGAADPPSTVPTRNKAPARRLKLFDFEITRPRLVCQWCNGALRRKAPVAALPQAF